jgi:hypothetical protein
VRYADGPASAAALAANRAVGAVVLRTLAASNAAVLRVPGQRRRGAGDRHAANTPGVIHVELDRHRTADPLRGARTGD